jgi:hypothetical protein
MSDNPTRSGMKLLELPDEDLIKIFSYLNQKSQFNAMLVCRRFESLIGQIRELYKNRSLTVTRQSKLPGKRCSEDPNMVETKTRKLNPEYWPFGIFFGEVTLSHFYFKPKADSFAPFMENLKIFGSKIIKLTIEDSTGYANRVLEVLRLTKNVQEMTIYFLDIYKSTRSKKIEQLNFPNLKSLKLVTIDNFVAIQDAFNQVKSLENLKLHSLRFSKWESYQPLLFRQSNLRSLELIEVKIDGFEWNELNLLEKLTLQNVTFPQKEAFEKFNEFMKTLEKVSELELDIRDDQRDNKNNYNEILKHLFNLNSLSKLTLFCENIGSLISGLQIQNPAVENLTTNQPAVRRYFPNLQQLRIKNTTVPNVNFVSTLEVARFIGENLGNLKHLELALTGTEEDEVTDYFKNELPHYRTAVKYVDVKKLITVDKI